MITDANVVTYYDHKTESILRKYGPGPRVHFHGGLVEPDTVPASTHGGLRKQLIESQENLLQEASRVWEATKYLNGTVLDIGCGLGGGAIFWAQEYGARVIAFSNVPRHLRLLNRFVAEARVETQVIGIIADAHAIPTAHVFDAAVAIDSMNHLDRYTLFQELALRVRRGGRVFINDTFAQLKDVRRLFCRYFMSNIGTLDEYLCAAEAAGFRLASVFDLTERVARFWEISALYSRALLDSGTVESEDEIRRLQRSMSTHRQLLQIWRDGGAKTALIALVH
jgi:tocopherol O-methyltransferase